MTFFEVLLQRNLRILNISVVPSSLGTKGMGEAVSGKIGMVSETVQETDKIWLHCPPHWE